MQLSATSAVTSAMIAAVGANETTLDVHADEALEILRKHQAAA